MTTPMRQQYLRIKKKYPDTVVFFRLGDFYETFDDDAKIVAKVCDIVLTSRPVGKDHRVPLAGVPYHSVEGYLAKLIEAGHKVAIVEQVGDVTGKGLVDREVVRVVTPGTVLEPSLLDERRNNYVLALILDGGRAGLAYADITTGEFAATQLGGEQVVATVVEEIDRLRPAEIVTSDPQFLEHNLEIDASGSGSQGGDSRGRGPLVTEYERWPFELETAGQAVLDHFEVASLDGFGVGDQPLAVRAAGGLLRYLTGVDRERYQKVIASLGLRK